MMCRGENMRMASLCDTSSYIFRHNSQDRHYSLGVTLSMLQGKTNREGKENNGVVVRNKGVEICPVGALAFYLLEMWMDPGDLPFDDPNWLKLYLIPGRFAFKEFSSGAHYATVEALFNAAGVVSKKKPHVARGTGSRHAQDAGADIASIENHGDWGKVVYQLIACPGSLTTFPAGWLAAHS
ncbi:hypothetical protein KVV02_008680 [Mortierella alpina]|uniref:Ndc10 domain-containing protein n=1 Tax=Mortierella alpina TaxID=64518 RepID=A0A9P8A159_MORAP|nr:hypothetical protein KVV02_008680 [Mortierella alpina]